MKFQASNPWVTLTTLILDPNLENPSFKCHTLLKWVSLKTISSQSQPWDTDWDTSVTLTTNYVEMPSWTSSVDLSWESQMITIGARGTNLRSTSNGFTDKAFICLSTTRKSNRWLFRTSRVHYLSICQRLFHQRLMCAELIACSSTLTTCSRQMHSLPNAIKLYVTASLVSSKPCLSTEIWPQCKGRLCASSCKKAVTIVQSWLAQRQTKRRRNESTSHN